MLPVPVAGTSAGVGVGGGMHPLFPNPNHFRAALGPRDWFEFHPLAWIQPVKLRTAQMTRTTTADVFIQGTVCVSLVSHEERVSLAELCASERVIFVTFGSNAIPTPPLQLP